MILESFVHKIKAESGDCNSLWSWNFKNKTKTLYYNIICNAYRIVERLTQIPGFAKTFYINRFDFVTVISFYAPRWCVMRSAPQRQKKISSVIHRHINLCSRNEGLENRFTTWSDLPGDQTVHQSMKTRLNGPCSSKCFQLRDGSAVIR